MRLRDLLTVISAPVTVASLCCLSPIILVLSGLGTVTLAGSLADILYGDYKWAFRVMGLIALIVALVLYFRRKGVCTLSAVTRHRNEILNTILVTLIAGILGYIFFLYVVVHYIGVWLTIWL